MTQVRYTGFRDRSKQERIQRFQNGCREGHTEIVFCSNGINVQLVFNPAPMMYHHHHHHLMNFEKELDFDKEHGKVSQNLINCTFILSPAPLKITNSTARRHQKKILKIKSC
jgi:hypothetical protein